MVLVKKACSFEKLERNGFVNCVEWVVACDWFYIISSFRLLVMWDERHCCLRNFIVTLFEAERMLWVIDLGILGDQVGVWYMIIDRTDRCIDGWNIGFNFTTVGIVCDWLSEVSKDACINYALCIIQSLNFVVGIRCLTAVCMIPELDSIVPFAQKDMVSGNLSGSSEL